MRDILSIIKPYLESVDTAMLRQIEQLIEQERRAAAEAMRERCRDIAYEVQQGADTEAETEIAGYIRAKINNIKLD